MISSSNFFLPEAQWERIGAQGGHPCFLHRYSKDSIEQHLLIRVPIKQLDRLTTRENYSFPFCPKIHKCYILNNYCTGSDLIFDVAILIEKIAGKCDQVIQAKLKKNIYKKLQNQLDHLLEGFYYLRKRYGSFIIDPSMIAWSQYFLVKVWHNSDFLKCEPKNPTQNEQLMIKSIIQTIEQLFDLKLSQKNVKSFEILMECLENNKFQKAAQNGKKVKFNTKQWESCSEGEFIKNQCQLNFNNQKIPVQQSSKTLRHSSSQEQLGQFQFDKRTKRSKSSGQSIKITIKNANRPASSHVTNAISQPKIQLTSNSQIGNLKISFSINKIQNKENLNGEIKIKRKQTKNLTCKPQEAQIGELINHSRRYSKNGLRDQPEIFSKTQQHFVPHRSSLLRQQLDCLFHSDRSISYDEKQLEKQLDDVL